MSWRSPRPKRGSAILCFMQLGRRRQALFLEAYAAVFVAALAVARGRGVRELERVLPEPASGAGDSVPPDIVRDVVWAVRAAARRMPLPSYCLVQVLAGRKLLWRRNIASQIRIGVKTRGGLSAHAWLMIGDRVVLEGDGLTDFSVLGTWKSRGRVKDG